MMADFVYVAVTNIPNNYHASDLRAHFSALVETTSFVCFHFRHRPEKQSMDDVARSKSNSDTHPSRECDNDSVTVKRCCVVKVSRNKLQELLDHNETNWTNACGDTSEIRCNISLITLATNVTRGADEAEAVHEENLLHMPELNPPDKMPNGNVGTPTLVFLDMIRNCLLPQTLIKKLNLQFPKTEGRRIYSNVNFNYSTEYSYGLRNESDKKNVSFTDSNTTTNLSETEISQEKYLKSPHKSLQDHVTSTKGNHPTPTAQFSTVRPETGRKSETILSETCSSSSKTGDMSSNQAAIPTADKAHRGSCETDFKQPLLLSLSAHERKCRKRAERRETRRLMAEGIEERLIAIEKRYHNDDDAEEWDRHEASEDDPSNQERNKERLYETEEETPWEKGGPGVVFYTDANFWQAREGDFDEQTTDDLDVDFSAYEEAGAGDRDIKEFLSMRQSERFRSGYDKTDRFSIGIARRLKPTTNKKFRPGSVISCAEEESKSSSHQQSKIGEFEKFSKGVGRRVMERQGWQEGQGLGSSRPGIKTALVAHGQAPSYKYGLGYKEPPHPVSQPLGLRVAKRKQKPHLISTIYDNPRESDPKVPLLQREEPTYLKYRHKTNTFSPT